MVIKWSGLKGEVTNGLYYATVELLTDDREDP